MTDKVEDKNSAAQRKSFGELLGQLANSSAMIVRDEIELVIQSVREQLRDVRCGILLVATGAVIGFAALLALCAALIIALTSYMDPVVAALSTGAALALIGVVVVFIGYGKLKKPLQRRTKNG